MKELFIFLGLGLSCVYMMFSSVFTALYFMGVI